MPRTEFSAAKRLLWVGTTVFIVGNFFPLFNIVVAPIGLAIILVGDLFALLSTAWAPGFRRRYFFIFLIQLVVFGLSSTFLWDYLVGLFYQVPLQSLYSFTILLWPALTLLLTIWRYHIIRKALPEVAGSPPTSPQSLEIQPPPLKRRTARILLGIGMLPPALGILLTGGALVILLLSLFAGNYYAILGQGVAAAGFLAALIVGAVLLAVYRRLIRSGNKTALIVLTVALYALPLGYFSVTLLHARQATQRFTENETRVVNLVNSATSFQECGAIEDARYETCMRRVLLETNDIRGCEAQAREYFHCLTVYVQENKDLDRCVNALGDRRRCVIEIAEQKVSVESCLVIHDDAEGFDTCVAEVIKKSYRSDSDCENNPSSADAAYCFFVYSGGGGTNLHYPISPRIFFFCDKHPEALTSIENRQFCDPCKLLYRDSDKQSCQQLIAGKNEWAPVGPNRPALINASLR
ncbi:MAG: phage holin family protein [Candidatus Kerfeldbacteria bacterium]|nr:phage holin family protein [Candidatus Kerfeldbacteria bacterium]